MKHTRKGLKKAFTLVELAVVIAVVAVIIAVIVPTFINLISSAKLTDNKVTIRNINEELSVDEALNGKPENIICVFDILFTNGYTIDDFKLDDGNKLVYNTASNSLIIYDSNFTSVIYPENTSTTSIVAAYYAVNLQNDLCVIGTEDIDFAVNAGFTQFYLYTTESTIEINTESEITLWIYTETEDVQITAENAVVYHNKSTSNCTSLIYTSLSDSSYNTTNISEDSAEKNTDSDTEPYSDTDTADTGYCAETETSTDIDTDHEEELPHTHEYGEWEIIEYATCTLGGLKRKTCSCGEFIDEEIPQLEHEYAETITEPTVNNQGFTTYTCTLCNDSYTDNFTDYLYTKELIFEKSSDGNYYIVDGISDTSITEIYIPAYYKNDGDENYLPVKEIGENAFYKNSAIISVSMGYTIEKIGDYAFNECKALKTVNIPENFKTFGTSCFHQCVGLSEIYYEAISAEDTGGYIFSQAGKESCDLVVYVSKEVKRIPQDLFNTYGTNMQACITAIIFEQDSVCTEIAKCAFYNILNLKTIVLPSSITAIKTSSIADITGSNIYFMGTEDEWDNGVIKTLSKIDKANIYFYSEALSDGCWYYDDKGEIKLW